MRLGKLPSLIFAGLLLAGCNSTESALNIGGGRANSPPISAITPDVASPAAPKTSASPAAQAAALTGTRMQFAPMIGAPVTQVTALSRRLTLRAKEKNLSIFPASEKNVTHILKGYFSLLNEGGKLTVLYVFDVIDPSGNRLHRINGQESAGAAAANASWESVPAPLMEKIADRTMDEFAVWRAGSGA
jgi:hypothetical protein